MRNYEIMFILSTQLTDEEKQAGVEFVEKTLTAAGATEVKTEIWGDRKLAYPIKKKENGYYVLTTFQADGTKFTEIESKLNINESILKYMIVKND
ncbi:MULTISPECIES: 30S ribosomal protein S6 [Leptotrichia]|jgi:ribosomal protein S6|uniref:Small ribosomal subunit protein bS6 n=2 Tax=Leptotrichia TaxID=32067 RepID=A0A510L3H8_9FUSO|nr:MULTISPECIES: 30S ribosomal protein S6 [Leptotrichia]ERK55015.1 ribosomal protein S6 [Leptotrichia sp. oral taxon 879 str. F0557]MDO4639571.1 30S ribosomal protein S6 [Leptotrichia hongkongensis]BBM58532.1 30S ribosomal protein S6 [Leptotrichia hongkongensis]